MLHTFLKQNYGLDIPKAMREDLGYAVKNVSDVEHKELTHQEVKNIFDKRYIKFNEVFAINGVHFIQEDDKTITASVTIVENGNKTTEVDRGNGRLNAVCKVINNHLGLNCDVTTYEEHAMTIGSDSTAIAYVGITDENGKTYFGAGVDPDIMRASIDALESAFNRAIVDSKN